LVDTLLVNSQQYYGIALREFLVQLTKYWIDNHLDIVRKLVDQFIRGNFPDVASGQVLRVAERFGLIAAVGELTTSMGITGREQGEATVSVSSLFVRWLEERGGGHPAEITKILAHVRALLEKYGDSRFEDLDPVGMHHQHIPSRWGYRDCVESDYIAVRDGYNTGSHIYLNSGPNLQDLLPLLELLGVNLTLGVTLPKDL
jgi:putative DNA primase/helicase